jgi:hypothetical protein
MARAYNARGAAVDASCSGRHLAAQPEITHGRRHHAAALACLIVGFIEPIEQINRGYYPFRQMRVKRARADAQTIGQLRSGERLSVLLGLKAFCESSVRAPFRSPLFGLE